MKYTCKAPWTIRRERISKLPPLHIMSGDLVIASFHETHDRGEDIANTNICSAAPEMYEAIKIGLTGTDSAGRTYDQAAAYAKLQEALNKAEGRTINEPAKKR